MLSESQSGDADEDDFEDATIDEAPMGGSAASGADGAPDGDAPDDAAATTSPPAPMGGSATDEQPVVPPSSAAPPSVDTAAAEKEAEEQEPPSVVSPMPSDPPPAPPAGADPWSSMVASSSSSAGDPGAGSGGGAVGAYDRVKVTDPQHHGDGRARYTTYRLIVASSTPDTKPTEVNRRYSDFQWLYRRLLREREGAIIPLIPHVTALTADARFSKAVVLHRLSTCEVWINRIVQHPELHSSPSLAAFLKSEDELFKEAKRSGDVDFADRGDEATDEMPGHTSSTEWGAAPGTSGGKSGSPTGEKRFRRIKNFAAKVKVGLRSNSELEKSDDEPAFDEIHEYIFELEVQIGWLSKHATALVKTYKDQHGVLENLGSKFAALGAVSFPNTHSSNASRLSTLLNKIGDGVSALGMNELARHDELTARFDRPVQDLVLDIQSLKVALSQRKDVQISYTNRVAKVQAKTIAWEDVQVKMKAYPAEREIREKEARGWVNDATDAAESKQLEFEAVTSRVIREVERFRTQFRDSVRAVVREWATVQQEYYGRANAGWGDILPFLDSPDLVEGDMPGGFALSGSGASGGQQNGGSGASPPQFDSV